MYPRLFQIGPFTAYSYGLMLGIAFIVAGYFFTKEFERRKMDHDLSKEITLYAIIFGIVGAKLFSLIENWNAFLADPYGRIISPGGLTFYGGFILAALAIYVMIKRKKIPFLVIADAAAPSLAIAYGIGRIGCHLSGDGDYGIPTTLPWGTNYENGTVPPSHAFRGSDIAKAFPNGIVPDNTPLHPTPVYEFFIMLAIFFVLYRLNRKQNLADGRVFFIYLIFAGIERLSVEFVRLNPRIMLGLSEAQLIAIGLVIGGSAGLIMLSNKHGIIKYMPSPFKENKKPKYSKSRS
jgi:phosphatidylglycerol:prolipoprotein diacylglycerol transferase